MNRRKRLTIYSIIAGLVLVLAIFIVRRYLEYKSVPEYVFRYAENQSEDYPTTLGALYFAELVEERTEGRIRIIVYSGGQLGREQDVLRQMQYGGIDFARVSISQMAGMIPKLNVLQMPYLYRDSEHMWSVLDGKIGKNFLEEAESEGLIGLSWYDAGTRNFYNSVKPIHSLEDMKGMKIRVQESSMMADMIECLGATPVQLSYEEVYSALEVGNVNGAENNWPSYASTQHYEVARYITEDEHTRVPEMQICSAETWNRLSPEDQTIIREAAIESAEYERTIWAEQETATREELIARGTEVTQLSTIEKERFRNATSSMYRKYCADYMDIIEEIMNVR